MNDIFGGFSETSQPDPFILFDHWMKEANDAELNDPNAMALATAADDGLPNVRMVLLKEASAGGFVFYTNTGSQKGAELETNSQAAGVLHWKSLRRQVRFRGRVESVTDAEADAYFASRSRQSCIGVWASRQSRSLTDREELEAAVAAQTERFEGGEVPRPPDWSGYRIRPISLEFWAERPYRLHERLVFDREAIESPWSLRRLYP